MSYVGLNSDLYVVLKTVVCLLRIFCPGMQQFGLKGAWSMSASRQVKTGQWSGQVRSGQSTSCVLLQSGPAVVAVK